MLNRVVKNTYYLPEVEDIKHMAFDCIIAKNIRNNIWVEFTQTLWARHQSQGQLVDL
jgi:hypothetical protein